MMMLVTAMLENMEATRLKIKGQEYNGGGITAVEDAAEDTLEVTMEEVEEVKDAHHKADTEVRNTALTTGIVLTMVDIVRL